MTTRTHALRTLLLITLLASLSGCNTMVGKYIDESFHDKHEVPYRRGYQVPPLTTSDPKHCDLSDNRINPYAFSTGASCALYDTASSTEPDKAQAARNQLQDAMIALSEQVGSKHVAGILFGEDQLNVWLGLGDLTFDALAVVATSTGSKTAFSAASALFGGTRALANSEIYKNVFSDAIARAIIEERKGLLASIREKQATGIDQYPVGQAISDAIAYHEAASFYSGMTLVQSDLNRGQIQRENTIRDILNRRPTTPPTDSERLSQLYAAIASTNEDEKLRISIGLVYDTTAELLGRASPPLMAGFDFNARYKSNKTDLEDIEDIEKLEDEDSVELEAFMAVVDELYKDEGAGADVLERIMIELNNTLVRNTKP